MNSPLKKNIIIAIFIVVFIDLSIGFSLFKSRLFSHLAMWNIIESDKKDDFYWDPEDAPPYFHFEPDSDNLATFRSEAASLVNEKNDDFEKVLRVAGHVMDICSDKTKPRLSLKWDSPEEMLKQIKEGAEGNCFHRSILLSTYLSSLGMKSRLWALENDDFDGVAHSVCEVYIRNLKKWVFIDAMLGFYVSGNGKALSFLELRENLLTDDDEAISICTIDGNNEKQDEVSFFYRGLIKCVFLRADNDFVNKYNARIRYGGISLFQRYIDRLPDEIRRGLGYSLGKRDLFIHYVDRFSRSLKSRIIMAKLFFYFFIFSLVSIGFLLTILSLSFLKRYLPENLSRKKTDHEF